MNKTLVVVGILAVGLGYWAFKGARTLQAYELARAELEGREEIRAALGPYDISYDWWFGVFRVLRYRDIQEFEFHLSGQKDSAIAAVDLRSNAGWEITCVNVVNGEYLNNRIIHDC